MLAVGDVVGSYCVAAPCPLVVADNFGTVHGFLLQPAADDAASRVTTIDFPGAGGGQGGAFGINARGDIVGAYFDASHRTHGYLRTRGDARFR